MNIEQPAATALTINRALSWSLRRLLQIVQFGGVAVVVLLLLGRSAADASDLTWTRINREVSGQGWDLMGWEVDAIATKAQAALAQPVQHLNAAERASVVRDYMARARIGALEAEINQLAATGSRILPEITLLQTEIDGLRHEQHLRQAAV